MFTAVLLQLCIILGLVHWAHMPFWAGVILFAVMQVNVMLWQVSVTVTGIAIRLILSEEPGDDFTTAPLLRAVDDDDDLSA